MFDYNSQFPSEMLQSVDTSSLVQSSLPVIVSWLLLLSSLPSGAMEDKAEAGLRISRQLEVSGCLSFMSEAELVSCYMGLRSLAPGAEKIFADTLQNNYGYRL